MHNYGHYTILFDWLAGTLRSPAEHEKIRAEKLAKFGKKKN